VSQLLKHTAVEVLPQLEAVKADIEGPYSIQLKNVDVVKVGMMKALREIGKLQEQMQQLEVGWLCVISRIINFDVQDMIISRFFFFFDTFVVQLEEDRG